MLPARRRFVQQLGALAALPWLPACAARIGASGEPRGFDEQRFAFELWQASGMVGNAALSPACVAMVLAMLEVGARRQTLHEIDDALHVGRRGELVEVIAARAAAWTGASEPRLRMAQALWVRPGLALDASYVAAMTRFAAVARELPGEGVRAQEAVNAWVAEQTEQRIATLVTEPPDPSVVAMLVSALHFEGTWADPFDPERTSSYTFTREDGVEIEVPTMVREQSFRVAMDGNDGEYPGYAIAELPYAGSLELDMLVILPPRGLTLADSLAQLDHARLSALIEMLDSSTIPEGKMLLTLPRFRVASRLSLLEPLRELGIVDAFDRDAADFRAMTDQLVHVGAFEHAVALQVDEQGTVASAAAVAEISNRSGPMRFFLDRPFFYVIRQRGGPWLFVGQVVDPLA
jgi:serpin B